MDDAVPLGMLDPSFPESRFAEFVPYARVNALQRRLSPPALTAEIDDKILFWLACTRAGLPTPPVRAILHRNRSGWTETGATPRSPREWAAALALLPDGELIAKPARGDRGEGVRAFELCDGRVHEHGRELGDGAALYVSLLRDRDHDEFVLQRRLHNHPRITELSGSPTLQTARIWTLLESPSAASVQDVTVLGGKLKFVCTDTPADNQAAPGTSGFVLVDLETGTLGTLVRLRADGLGQETLAQHPRTGAVYTGLRVPLWKEACELARRAALAFPLLRTLGWDVALTPDGPALVETNAGWGPSNELGVAPLLTRRLEAALDDGAPAGRTSRARAAAFP